ncbi:MAG TPA: CopG family transcriptional regulator [Firmicutes bacterium]|jgi:CopG family transcriptional regulator/antitoxin EndoAI|nr:CopG family transcriptional regulator [Bacillota bacterium]
MTNRRVVVLLPESLLEEVDKVAQEEYSSRSAFIRAAMTHLLADKRQAEKREKMVVGYQKMGPLNLELAEEGIGQDMQEIDDYMESLVAGEDY